MTAHENIIQERVSTALQHLGLDPTNEESDGSTLQHKVTQEAVDRLLSLLQGGQSIHVDAAGNVTSIK